ncbi:hypothetical protein [Granulibacter bethesdensis]|nr:hypothetical protein [Granulibacter bethesdensis]
MTEKLYPLIGIAHNKNQGLKVVFDDQIKNKAATYDMQRQK